jgi:hypothetical protein
MTRSQVTEGFEEDEETVSGFRFVLARQFPGEPSERETETRTWYKIKRDPGAQNRRPISFEPRESPEEEYRETAVGFLSVELRDFGAEKRGPWEAVKIARSSRGSGPALAIPWHRVWSVSPGLVLACSHGFARAGLVLDKATDAVYAAIG